MTSSKFINKLRFVNLDFFLSSLYDLVIVLGEFEVRS